MNDPNDADRPSVRWALLRFAVVGPLLAAPPAPRELGLALKEIAARTWKHPITCQQVRFSVSTVERWYYLARSHPQNPVGALTRRQRKDLGLCLSMKVEFRRALWAQYKAHPNWSYLLHVNNLEALVEKEPSLGPMPSYSSVRRYMRAQGMVRRPLPRDTPGARAAMKRLDEREVRSFEAAFVLGLWHLDFHHGSLKIPGVNGNWVFPVVLAILDDCSRLACHVQWYIDEDESAETLVHGLSQAIQKRGLPRALMTDNGSAMIAGETQQGFKDLGIIHETTLPASPYQNGKQENFWSTLEGRLMRMLDREEELTLQLLNEATQAWVEMEYNRHYHSELGQSPLERYLKGPSVERESPTSERLREVFRREVRRTQRRSDGTLSLEGRRYEIPSRYRHLQKIWVRYARWNLGYIHLVDGRSGKLLCRLYPQDKAANASGQRRKLEIIAGGDPQIQPADVTPQKGRAPLLAKLLADYAATGYPAAYVPHHRSPDSPANTTDNANPTTTLEEDEA